MTYKILSGLFLGHKVQKVDTWRRHWLGDVGVHHGVTFNFGSANVCSPAIFEAGFSYHKDTWITATGFHTYFKIIVIFTIDSYSSVNKFYSVTIFSCLNCLVLILNIYIHFYSIALNGWG